MHARRIVVSLFRPATAVVGRLRYAQKFIVVGLVLFIPLGLVAKAYVDLQRGQVAFSAKERLGVEMTAPLVAFTDRVVQARHEAVTPGARTLDLSADLARLDAVDRRVGGRLGTSPAWAAARAMVIQAQSTQDGAAEQYQTYTSAVEALLALIVRVGDQSNLTVDPDLDTFYLVETLQFRLPMLLDIAGRSADRSRLAASRHAADTDDLVELGLYNGMLESARKSLASNIATVVVKTRSDATRRALPERFRPVDEALGTLSSAIRTAVQQRRTTAVLPAAGDGVRAATRDFAAVAATDLDALLRARIQTFAGRARGVEILTGLAALLAIYLFVGFYLSVASPIRRIVGTLHAVARGDLTSRVSVDTHDELGFVAVALNDTIARTEAVTGRLAERATQDPLTSLPNRDLILDRLGVALHRTQRTATLMAVLFIDLDGFKIINDSLGHEAGDEVLTVIARRLTAMVRASDTVGRLAGDEFVVIAEGLVGRASALELAERIIDVLTEPIVTEQSGGPREVGVGASVGIAFADGSLTVEPSELLRDADVAMYKAKQRGRGRAEVFDEALHVAVERRLETQHELRRAIDHGQIRVHYQPIVDTAGHAVLGFEALVRWEHPRRGLLGPGEFIEVAEETGLIVPLGAAVLREACTQTAHWRATRRGCADLHVSVNVSGLQFGHPSFVPAVAAALADSGLDPDALWLEITETSLMADVEAAHDTLRQLRELGVHLAVDDFGTGYSSLAYLRRLPVEVLKIDRSFVAGLGADREDEAIAEMIVGLARTLDLMTVAEGVETAGQLAHLHRLGCTAAQGYYFARPAPADRVWDLVAEARDRSASAAVSA